MIGGYMTPRGRRRDLGLDPEQREMIERAAHRDRSRDYSQSGEQEAILRAVEGLPVGRFLDIGAGDGITFSNTRALALAGWGGVCVEPAAWAVDRLLDLYANTGVQVCQAVVTERCGLTTLLYSRDDHLSTVERGEAEKWPQVPFRHMHAATVTIAQVLDWFELGASVVVSIDAEGRSTEIVRAYQRHPAWEQVRVLCVEKERQEVTWMQGWEQVVRTPNNTIYKRAS